ncbi:DUF4097 domain-containing protein [Nocardiopsis sp. NPDC058631]|uniref:DUF4097 family beta strand repeat-containing protein n=1 Tax=Nocardiopsis sp. NPDC058631 TaxID=3346566 RepID=UPI0036470010
MPSFDTPEPVSVTLEFDIGTVRITAGERADTVVDVRPSDAAQENDVRDAERTRVTCTREKLLVRGPKNRSLFGRSGSVDITIGLPAGSHVRAEAAVGDLLCEGRLGDLGLRVSAGDIQVAEARSATVKSGYGTVRVDAVDTDADVSGSDRVHVGRVGGTATVTNHNGETTVGEVVGELRARSANGRITVAVAHAGVDARSANGSITVGEVARGQVALRTTAGKVEVGIRESSAAWLDVDTRLGKVHQALEPVDGPHASEETVRVRARTGLGDIVVRRA